jgi:hypothetical protein
VAVVIQSLQLNGDKDVWSYIWGNAQYSSQKAYKHLLRTQTVHPAFGWLWKSLCQMKHKVFFWLLLQNRLNTRVILRRRNMALESYTCELCIRQREETLSHLFLRCPFAKNCWLQIGVSLPTWVRPKRATTYIKTILGVPFRMEIIVLMCWSIWKERNGWIFSNEDPSVSHCMIMFKNDFALVIHRAKERFKQDMSSWLHNLS